MNKRSFIIITVTSVIFLCTASFFCRIYQGHIQVQELYQLFEFTGDYFTAVVSPPGGFADWCGRFLTQFFIFPWAGGIIIAALMLILLLLSRKLNSGKELSGLMTAIIPPVFLFSMFLSDESLTGAAVSVILPMTASVLFRKMSGGPLRTLFILLNIPVLFYLCGPAAILFALILPPDEGVPVKAAGPVLLLLCPAVFQFFVHYPLSQLYVGLHYVRIPSNLPSGLWLTVFSIIATFYISEFTKVKKKLSIITSVVFLSFGLALIPYRIDMEKENTVRCELMARDGDWDGIIRNAKSSQPGNTLTLSCLNLALAEKALLPECQFSFNQAGEKGLFPSYSISYRSLPCISEIYWHLGMVNACQQYIFDAQESIPDFQKSGRCYKRLAETNIINGDFKVAEKYLDALGHTLFYRRWAIKTRQLIDSPETIDSHPIYGLQRRLRADDAVILFNEGNKYSMCKGLLEHNPDNHLAEEYLYSLLLLKKDLEGFGKAFAPDRFEKIPKHYQEALLLICLNDRKPLDSVSGTVSEKNLLRMESFIRDIKARTPEGTMLKKYGDTYWYYTIYR